MMGDMEIALAALAVVLAAVVVVLALRRPTATPVAPPTPALDPEALLAPIREQLRELQRKVHESETAVNTSSASLGQRLEQIGRQYTDLQSHGQRLENTTTQISTALRGTGVAGDWGEMQLRRTVELAGLTEHVSFTEQETIRTSDGHARPDLIVRLPLGRCIIVDAKAPLIDFDGNTDAAVAQAGALKQHIDDLHRRDYGSHHDGALDAVILFVPTEGILASALGREPALAEYAVNRKVLLATPMTLLAMLRAVEHGWLQTESTENAKKIVEDSTELLSRLATFSEHFNRVGGGLRTALDNYNKAVGSFQDRVRPQADRMRDHGLRAGKALVDLNEVGTNVRSIDSD